MYSIRIDSDHYESRGRLEYDTDSYSFNYVYDAHAQSDGRSWICYGCIEVAIDLKNGQLLGCSGLSNIFKWSRVFAKPHANILHRRLFISDHHLLVSGVAYTYPDEACSNTCSSFSNGWFRIGESNTTAGSAVEFASGCIATIYGDKIAAIWLHPSNWRQLLF